MKIDSKLIIDFFEKIVINYSLFNIENVCSIFDLKENSVTYIYKNNIDYLQNLKNFNNNVLVIVPSQFKDKLTNFQQTFILSDTPKQDFVKLLNKYFVMNEHFQENISAHSIVHRDAEVHSTVKVGHFSVLGSCKIGENSIICNNVEIFDNVVIGKNVKIYSGCRIGTADFGPVRLDDNSVIMFPQIGGLIVEDNVEIFPMTCIGKGTLGHTIIKKGVKIDHQCQIGHNSYIGENSVITAQTIVCGSTRIGKNCYLGVNSVLRNEKSIGDNVIVGMGSVITKDFGSNLVIYGNPAIIIRENLEIFKF